MKSLVTVLFVVTLASTAEAQTYYQPNQTYANPDSTTTQQWRGKGCLDPWVALALNNVFGRVDASKCGTALYNGGQWRSFNELVHAVGQTKSVLESQGVATRLVKIDGRALVEFSKGGTIVAVGGGNLIGHDGATLIGDGAGTLRTRTARYVAAGTRVLSSESAIRLPVGQIVY